ncbi:SagB/ThcOx family dehydrogenase [Sphaerisporangium sp. NPDC005289]|uniref:SagB/ThcOx family dehydrogenase n=1 Tax=Sphaerisporangium sp. NPDC005289 TaxID=3155247 RepID=UPI0033A35053
MRRQSAEHRQNSPEPPVNAAPRWAAGTVVIPDEDGKATVRSPFANSAVLMGRRALISLAAGENDISGLAVLRDCGLLEADAIDDDTGRGLEHWHARGWSHALTTYLWSRRASFQDDGEAYRDRQMEALATFLREDGPPPSPRRAATRPMVLPEPAPLPETPVGEVLRKRVTSRTLHRRAFGDQRLSDLLGHGLARASRNRDPDPADPQRFLFSYGAAFDYYVAVYDVHGIESGIHLYDPSTHALDDLGTVHGEAETRAACKELFIGQRQVETAAATVFVVADFPRYQWRYRHERGLRNLYFDSARVGQALILVATACGLQTWLTPAVRDSLGERLFQLAPIDHQVLTTVTVA